MNIRRSLMTALAIVTATATVCGCGSLKAGSRNDDNHCALYLTTNHIFTPDEAKQISGADSFSVEPKDSSEDWERINLGWGKTSMTLSHRTGKSPSLPKQKAGMQNFAFKMVDGKMDARVFDLLQNISRVKHEVGVTVTPSLDGNAKKFIDDLAKHSRALVFKNQQFYDSAGKLYLAQDGKFDKDAAVYVSPSAVQRRERTNKHLQSKSIRVAKSLPTIEGDDEVTLRSPSDVAKRTLALWTVIYRADNGKNPPESNGKEELSPEEQAFVKDAAPSDKDKNRYLWRSESLAVLLWALGKLDELPPPDKQVQVPELGHIMSKLNSDAARKEFVESAKLRSPAEILDTRDLLYRMHWASEEQKEKGEGNLILWERHLALNWLTNYMDQDWDDVKPDT